MTRLQIDDLVIAISEKRMDGSYVAWDDNAEPGSVTGWGMTRMSAASDLLDSLNEHRIARLGKLIES